MRAFLLAGVGTVLILSTAFAGDIEYKIIGPFDASELLFISEDDRKNIENIAKNPDYSSTFVLAISESGIPIYWTSDESTQDRIRRSVQICEHVSGGQCGLAVVNGEMVEFEVLPRQLTYSETFDIEAVPFAPQHSRKYLREYDDLEQHKALALNYNGLFWYWYGADSEYGAKKNALDVCRRDSGWGNCFLYDVNGTVVFDRHTDIFGGQ